MAGARDAFGKKILDLQTAWAKLDAALSYPDYEISDSSYGLDSSKPEDKKKIEQVNLPFSKFFDYCSASEISSIIMDPQSTAPLRCL